LAPFPVDNLCHQIGSIGGAITSTQMNKIWIIFVGALTFIQINKNKKTSGLYYKTILISIMAIISDAPNCGIITYDCN